MKFLKNEFSKNFWRLFTMTLSTKITLIYYQTKIQDKILRPLFDGKLNALFWHLSTRVLSFNKNLVKAWPILAVGHQLCLKSYWASSAERWNLNFRQVAWIKRAAASRRIWCAPKINDFYLKVFIIDILKSLIFIFLTLTLNWC